MDTDAMESAALQRAFTHAMPDQEDAARIWQQIEADARRKGPFSAMIRAFRDSASEALSALTMVDPTDATEIRALQNEIQRCLKTMMIVQEFRTGARAYDANAEAENSGEYDDDPFTPDIEPRIDA